MSKKLEEYRKRLEELHRLPEFSRCKWEPIAFEYRILRLELDGMEEFPDRWIGEEDHPGTHFRALELLLKETG